MPLDLQACAPTVHPTTIEWVIRVEDPGANPYAINVNGLVGARPRQPANAAEAVDTAKKFMRLGYSVDLGVMQVNNRNLPALGYTIEQMFDACTNLMAGSRILTAAYNLALQTHPAGQEALKVALSIYNTGDPIRGFTNGYVAKYYRDIPAINQFPPQVVNAAVAVRTHNPYTSDAQVWWSDNRER